MKSKANIVSFTYPAGRKFPLTTPREKHAVVDKFKVNIFHVFGWVILLTHFGFSLGKDNYYRSSSSLTTFSFSVVFVAVTKNREVVF